MTRIGRYEIESEIGRGAMGIVYLARDPRLQRQVALKTYLLPAGLSPDAERDCRERFVREARAAGRLTHPGVVTVHDVDQDPETGNLFITMEHVPGTTLERMLAEGPLAPEAARSIAEAVAEALGVAHTAGIVHRDIKPANILVRAPDGRVKVADFGVALLSATERTRTGVSVGSPAYMSPEQVRGRELDGRSDLFSLAAVLYEMLCGERPFAGPDPAALAYAIAHERPLPIEKRVAGLPPAVAVFLERALAKEPGQRFATSDEFRAALSTAFSARTTEPDPSATCLEAPRVPVVPRRRAFRRLVAVGGLALAIGFVAWWNRNAYLHLDARCSVPESSFALLVNGEEVYARELFGKESSGLFRKVLGNAESFEALIEVPPGRHEVTARIVPQDGAGAYEDTIVVEFDRRQTRRLRMAAGRAFGSALSLKVD